jgi:hypothetical protein
MKPAFMKDKQLNFLVKRKKKFWEEAKIVIKIKIIYRKDNSNKQKVKFYQI